MRRMRRFERGFTLIELLIVIVIIGILAGVLISVIDPAAQQNRAKDANVKATMNKVALATQGYISAYGVVPTDAQFIGSLDNASADCVDAAAAGDYVCHFTVTGNALPATCSAANGYTGDGTGQCAYRYDGTNPDGDATTADFRLYGKSFGMANTVFMYDNMAGEIVNCSDAATPVCP